MRRLVVAIATLIMFSITAFAGEASGVQDARMLGAKLWKTAKRSSSIKNKKDDLTIVYGGEDTHKLSAADSFIA